MTIQINEVGPRDGLQNESRIVSPDHKINFINALSASGLTSIEATSFVSPEWVPQLADHETVYRGILKKTGIRYPVLVPNMKGFDAAMTCGVKDIAIFTAASDAFTRKNTNCSLADSLQRVAEVAAAAKTHNVSIRGYISCVIACPYAGNTDPRQVLELSQQLLSLGCFEVSLGDTIGVATPRDTEKLLSVLLDAVPTDKLAMHFHDTNGGALDNIDVSLQAGIQSFDSSVGGLGGCPYAKGASGNVATEKVVALLHGRGLETGVDLEMLQKALAVLEF